MQQILILSDLVNHCSFGAGRYVAPYSLAAQLEQAGFSTTVIDYFLWKENFFSYLETFLSEETLIVGLSTTFLTPPEVGRSLRGTAAEYAAFTSGCLFKREPAEMARWFAELKALMRRKSPQARLVLGGAKTSSVLRHPQAYADVDYFCLGAGESALISLAQALAAGHEPAFETHAGLRFLATMQMKVTQDLCPTSHFTRRAAVQASESLPIEISRGCLYNCKFCHFEKRQSIRKDLEDLRRELIHNYENFGTTVYHFADDCFNDRREKVEAYCGLFLSLPFQIEWVSYARVDVAVRFPETIDLMIKSGARALFWGLESFNDVVARNAGKGTPIPAVKAMLKEFQRRYKHQCLTAGSFIVGLPGESKESLKQTANYICENDLFGTLCINPLFLSKYSMKLDQKVVDFADYSRNPEKHGFRRVEFDPYYWEHEHMNSIEAEQIHRQISEQWYRAKPPGLLRTIWNYTHLRSLGFSHDEIHAQTQPHPSAEVFLATARSRYAQFIQRYFVDLASANRARLVPLPAEA